MKNFFFGFFGSIHPIHCYSLLKREKRMNLALRSSFSYFLDTRIKFQHKKYEQSHVEKFKVHLYEQKNKKIISLLYPCLMKKSKTQNEI